MLALDDADPTPTTVHVLATAAYYQLTPADAAVIERQVRHAVRKWQAVAKAHGAKRAEIELMASVIDADR